MSEDIKQRIDVINGLNNCYICTLSIDLNNNDEWYTPIKKTNWKEIRELLKELTVREEKLVEALQDVVNLVRNCHDCIELSDDEELKTTLREFGIEE